MLVIRGFEERVAALYRDGEVPGFVHLSIGQEASAVGACWPLGPADVITSTHRGHGHCLAKGLDPLGMFAELMAKDDGHQPRPRRLDAHRRPDARHLRRQRDRGRGTADRGRRGDRGAAARTTARVAVAFFGDGAVAHGSVPRSGEPRRGVAAAGDLLLREQRLRRVLARVARSTRRRSRSAPRATASSTSRSTATTSSRPRPRCTTVVDARARRRRARASSRRRPTAGTVTTKAIPQRYRTPDEVAGVGGARPAARARAPPPRRGRRPTTRSTAMRVDRSRASSTPRSTPPAGSPPPAVATLDRLRRPPAPRTAPSRPHPPADAPVFRTMDAIRTALEVELAADERVFVAGIDVAAGGNVFGLTRGLHDEFGDRVPRHADLRERDHRPRRRRGDGGHAPGRRADVPRLPRRVPRPAAQPGGEAAVHDRRRRADGADRAHAVRRRALVGQPALAEPRGAARAHPRADRGDAVDAGRHLRPAARRDPGPEPGRVHREPAALRHEGTAAAGRPRRSRSASPRSCARAPTSRSCRCHGWCTRRSPRPRARRRRRHLGRGDRPAHRRAARHRADPRVGARRRAGC